MPKPQDYEYRYQSTRLDRSDSGEKLSNLAACGWEPVFTYFVPESFWTHGGIFHVLRRLRPEVPHA